jgi:hypothetical protein
MTARFDVHRSAQSVVERKKKASGLRNCFVNRARARRFDAAM